MPPRKTAAQVSAELDKMSSGSSNGANVINAPIPDIDMSRASEARIETKITQNAPVRNSPNSTNETNNRNGAGTVRPLGTIAASGLLGQQQQHAVGGSSNPLKIFLDKCAAYKDETLLAMIVGLPDGRTRMSVENFMPIVLDATNSMAFMQQLQSLTIGGGGRFNVTAVDAEGYEIAQLNNFAIAPLKSVAQATNTNQNGELANVIKMMFEQQAKQSEQILLAIKEQSNQKPDAFRQALELKMLDLITSDKPTQIEKPENTVETIIANSLSGVLASKTVLDALAKTFSSTLNPANSNEDNRPFWERLAENPQTQERILQVVEGVTDSVIDGITFYASKQTATNKGSNRTRAHKTIDIDANTPETVESEIEETESNENEMINLILAEFEGETPINAENALLAQLALDYPQEYDYIAGYYCQRKTFPELVQLLLQYATDEHRAKYTDAAGNPNDLGKKVSARMKEFYDFVRGGGQQNETRSPQTNDEA